MSYFSRGDRLFILLLVCVTFLFSGLLYSEYNKRSTEGKGEIIGTITFKQRVAQRKHTGTVIWETLEESAPLRNKDSIRTSDLSEAEITLLDGTKIDLDENSMILLNLGKEGAELDFAYGKISAGVTGDNSKLKIKAGERVVEAKDSQLSLKGNFSENAGSPTSGDKTSSGLSLTVEKGEATFQGNGENIQVAANQKLTQEGGEIKKNSIPVTDLSPGEVYRLGSSDSSTIVNFSWLGEKEGNIIVSRYKNLAEPIKREKTSAGKLKLSLPSGDYYWRLETKNYKSTVRKISIYKWEAPIPFTPGTNTKLESPTDSTSVYFSWKKISQGNSYILQIADSQSWKTKIPEDNTKWILNENLRFTSFRKDLPTGEYSWRVGWKNPLDNTISWSEKNSFRIIKKENLEPPSLIQPPTNASINSVILAKKGVLFSWKPIASSLNYEIQIQDNSGNTIFTTRTSKSSYIYQASLQTGTYTWKARSLKSSLESSWTETRTFTINNQENLEVIEPTGDNLHYVSLENPLSFRWKKLSTPGIYKIILELPGGKSSTKESKVPSLNWPGLKSGKYSWKVQFLDVDKTPIAESKSIHITIKEGLVPPILIKPIKRTKVDLTYANDIVFEWKPSPFVKFYRLEISPSGKTNSPLYKEQTINSSYKLNRLNRLSTGFFQWRVVSISKEGLESESDWAEFEVFLNPDKGKLEFTSPETFYVDP